MSHPAYRFAMRFPWITGLILGTTLSAIIYTPIIIAGSIYSKRSYEAWVKLTGNPQHLTQQEFNVLPRLSKHCK